MEQPTNCPKCKCPRVRSVIGSVIHKNYNDMLHCTDIQNEKDSFFGIIGIKR